MIKQIAQSKIKFIVLGLLVFLVSAILQINFGVSLFLLSLWAYVECRRLNLRYYNMLNITFLFVISFTSSYFIMMSHLSPFYIPFALMPMLAVLLFNDLEIALLVSLAGAFSVASFSNSPLQFGMLALTSGILSSILVQGARKRSTVINAGLLVGLIQVIFLIVSERLWIGLPNRYIILFLNGLASSIIVLGALPLFEYLFRTATNISLLELADFHHPILQRMILEAPGTYHHSLVVGNLSETASNAVGANALLARIGAYYHDIGKLTKPEYFSENQDIRTSKHDTLSPTISKMIIMNHVKEGVELAKKYRLNPSLMDFISQHHGNSLVYYFYRRALETIEEDQEIKEEGFRYTGPKPNSKETAIVLLADSVEAATRAMRDPSPAKVEEVVHKVINNKFIDGQLDECDLTLKDLEKIAAVFIRILSGIYHSRVVYPEETRSENNHKKPAKEDSRQPDKDKKSDS